MIGDTDTLKQGFAEEEGDDANYPHWWYVRSAVVRMITIHAAKSPNSWIRTLESLSDLVRSDLGQFEKMSVMNGLRVLLQYAQNEGEESMESKIQSSDNGRVRTDDVMISELLERYGIDLLMTCSFVDRNREEVIEHYRNSFGDNTEHLPGEVALQCFLEELHHMISVDELASELPLEMLASMMGLPENV